MYLELENISNQKSTLVATPPVRVSDLTPDKMYGPWNVTQEAVLSQLVLSMEQRVLKSPLPLADQGHLPPSTLAPPERDMHKLFIFREKNLVAHQNRSKLIWTASCVFVLHKNFPSMKETQKRLRSRSHPLLLRATHHFLCSITEPERVHIIASHCFPRIHHFCADVIPSPGNFSVFCQKVHRCHKRVFKL